jgi:hypothetical protein
MKLTKENATEYVEKVLADPDKRKKLVESIIESGVIDFEEELSYGAYYSISESFHINLGYNKASLADKKFFFEFKKEETAELWAKKLSALNKLRMIKELVDDKKIENTIFLIDNNGSKNNFYWAREITWKENSITLAIYFSSQKTCERAIELMGKEALDDLFLEIN